MNYTRKLVFIFLACFAKALSGAQVADSSQFAPKASPFLNLQLHFAQESKLIKIKVTPNTTVKALMSYVKNRLNINPDEQLLVYKSNDLNNRFEHLRAYGIKDGADLYVFKIPKPLNESLSDTDFILSFVQENGSKYRLYVNPNFTVGELKTLINKTEYMTYGVPVNLLIEKYILGDDLNLMDIGIYDGIEILVYPKK